MVLRAQDDGVAEVFSKATWNMKITAGGHRRRLRVSLDHVSRFASTAASP
jgi:hypothetical protein